MNNISINELIYSDNYIINHNKANSIFIYLFQLFLLYKLLPIILLNLSKLFYFFSLYLVNYSDESNF